MKNKKGGEFKLGKITSKAKKYKKLGGMPAIPGMSAISEVSSNGGLGAISEVSSNGESAIAAAAVTKAQRIREHRSKILRLVDDFFKKIYETIKSILFNKTLFKHLAKYIAFIIFIIFLVLFFLEIKSDNNKNKNRSDAYDTKKQSFLGKTRESVSSLYDKVSGFSSPLGKKAMNGISRENEEMGRCDNIDWVSYDSIGLCYESSIIKPASIRWTITPENLYEYDLLPPKIREKIKTKTTITIPYVLKDSSYVLSCKDAVYEDNTSAKGLFSDETNSYCKLNTKFIDKSYKYVSKERPIKTDSNYSGLDGYK